jgi:peptidoglycan-associated lipoprotein
VYFDFDSFTVKDEFRPTIEAHARYLQQNRSARMTIQGNTDERGSREYNIALGQKRAEAVKRMMTVLGAQEQQIETVSFGKEKPKAQGHDESSWAENRRDDILYAGE